VRAVEFGDLGEEVRALALRQGNTARALTSQLLFLGLELLDIPPGASPELGYACGIDAHQDKHKPTRSIESIHKIALVGRKAVQAKPGVSELLALDQEAQPLEHAPFVANGNPAVRIVIEASGLYALQRLGCFVFKFLAWFHGHVPPRRIGKD
jgi:hypothetical protein